jgi:hypothetical protein
MSYILTIINNKLNKTPFLSKSIKCKQYVYKYDDCIGIYNQHNSSFISYKSTELISNHQFLFEKIEKNKLTAPPPTIDDFYEEEVSIYSNFNLIGSDSYIIQFTFNTKEDYNNIGKLIPALFETKVDISDITSFVEKLPESKPIYKSVHKPIHTTIEKRDNKSKYIEKNKSKYIPKHISKERFESKIVHQL